MTPPGYTFDAGALIAIDRGDRRVATLIARSVERGGTITVPATALAQAIRAPERQARLMQLIRRKATKVVALDGANAPTVGRLLAITGTSDIADAHVVVCARRAGQTVVTTDPDDVRQLDPSLPILAL